MNKKIDYEKYVLIISIVLVLAFTVYALLSSSAESWRYLYCQSSAAHALECTAKGWW